MNAQNMSSSWPTKVRVPQSVWLQLIHTQRSK